MPGSDWPQDGRSVAVRTMLPSSPPLLIAADLGPVDTESFRSRYGQ
jgi:hypothetical protein